MATTYTSTKTQTDTYIYQYIKVIEGTQDVTANTTRVTVEVWLNKITTTATSTSQGKINLTVDGSVKTASGGTSLGSVTVKSPTDVKVYSWTGDITHTKDGSKELTVIANIDSSYLNGLKKTQTFKVSLTTIPRASSFGTITGTTIGSETTVNITRASTSFTHTLTGTINGTRVVNLSNLTTSAKFTLPINGTAQLITGSKTGVLKLTLTTKNGSTTIGTATKDVNVTVPSNSDTKPALTATYQPSNTGFPTAFSNLYIKGMSAVALTISSEGKLGATVSSGNITTTMSGKDKTGTSVVTDVITEDNPVVKVVAKDSRGITTSKSITIPTVDYTTPVITTVDAYRCDEEGEADEYGEKVKLVAGQRISPVNGLNHGRIYYRVNEQSWKLLATDSDYSGVLSETFATGSAYSIDVKVTDDMGNETLTNIRIPTAYVTFALGAYGRSVGIGTYPQRDGFEVAMDMFMDGHDSPVGSVVDSEANNSNLSVDPGVTANLCSITLGAGVWIVQIACSWSSNATGYRKIQLVSGEDFTNGRATTAQELAISGVAVRMQNTYILTSEAEITYKLLGYQNSGATLTAYPYIRAVRIL